MDEAHVTSSGFQDRATGAKTMTSKKRTLPDRDFLRAPGLAEKEPMVIKWLKKAQAVEKRALETENDKTLKLAQEFVSSLLQVKQLINCFHRSPGRQIGKEGGNGVAGQLKLTRNAVYARIDHLGLTAEDFKDPLTADIELLVTQRSKKLAQLLEAVFDQQT